MYFGAQSSPLLRRSWTPLDLVRLFRQIFNGHVGFHWLCLLVYSLRNRKRVSFLRMRPGELIPQSHPAHRPLVLFIGGAADVSAFVSDSLRAAFAVTIAANEACAPGKFDKTNLELIIVDDAPGTSAERVVEDIRARREC